VGSGGGGGGGSDASSDESGMSERMSAGRAAQIIPLLDGRGPDGAVWAIGEGRLTDTPFMVTSVGALISKGPPRLSRGGGGAAGGGAGGRRG
jgi:hypothetical protein